MVMFEWGGWGVLYCTWCAALNRSRSSFKSSLSNYRYAFFPPLPLGILCVVLVLGEGHSLCKPKQHESLPPRGP